MRLILRRSIRCLLFLTVLTLPSAVAEAGPIMKVLAVGFATTGTGITYDWTGPCDGPDGCDLVPVYTISIDNISDTPLSALEVGPFFELAAQASGSIDGSGGDLYTYASSDDEGLGWTENVTATASARFVSLVSRLNLTLFTIQNQDVDSQRSVALYDETMQEFVFRTWPFPPFEGGPIPTLWGDHPDPFVVKAHVGHVYSLTSYSYDPHNLGVEAGVRVTGTPVADEGSTLLLFVAAMAIVSLIRVSRRVA